MLEGSLEQERDPARQFTFSLANDAIQCANRLLEKLAYPYKSLLDRDPLTHKPTFSASAAAEQFMKRSADLANQFSYLNEGLKSIHLDGSDEMNEMEKCGLTAKRQTLVKKN